MFLHRYIEKGIKSAHPPQKPRLFNVFLYQNIFSGAVVYLRLIFKFLSSVPLSTASWFVGCLFWGCVGGLSVFLSLSSSFLPVTSACVYLYLFAATSLSLFFLNKMSRNDEATYEFIYLMYDLLKSSNVNISNTIINSIKPIYLTNKCEIDIGNMIHLHYYET